MPNDIDLDEPVFLYYEGLPVPFFIESFQTKGSTKAIIKLEDIDSFNESEEIVGQKIYYPEELAESDDSEETLPIIGYTVLDQNKTTIGEITAVNDFSGNLCIEIGETMIPIHEELIIKMDDKKKIIQIEIPEGLL